LIRHHLSRAFTYARAGGIGPLLLRSVAGTGFVRFSAVAASFLVGVQLARALGPEGYGYYGMALAIITVAAVPGEMGIPRLVTRDVAVASAKHDDALLFGVLRWADLTAIRVSAVVLCAVLLAGYVLSETQHSALVYAMLAGAPMIPLLPLARIRCGALQGLHHIVRGQVPDVLLRPMLLCFLIFIVSVSGRQLTPAAAMALNSVTALAVFLVASRWLRQQLPPVPAQIRRDGKSWMASSIPIGLTDGMRTLHSELTVLLLGFILTPASAGLFRIANVSSFTAATPVAILTYVGFPIIARLYADGNARQLQQVLTRLAQVQFASVAILCLPLLLFPGPLLALVFGPEYVPAANALRILAGAQIIMAGLGLNYALLNMTHNERRVTRAASVALVLNVAGVTVLSYFLGLTGAAIAVSATLVISNLLIWRDARRLLGLETSIIPARLLRPRPSGWRPGQDEPHEPGEHTVVG
jgi:O-antigen/teichoic acid export membrane protein